MATAGQPDSTVTAVELLDSTAAPASMVIAVAAAVSTVVVAEASMVVVEAVSMAEAVVVASTVEAAVMVAVVDIANRIKTKRPAQFSGPLSLLTTPFLLPAITSRNVILSEAKNPENTK